MRVILTVGTVEREIREEAVGSRVRWSDEPDADRPLAGDEQALLDELTRLCRGILIDDAPPALGR